MSRRIAALVAVLGLVLAGCLEGDPEFSEAEQLPAEEAAALGNGDEQDAGNGEDGGADATATFVAVDNEFTDAPEQVSAGTVEFELVNEGNATHNVAIDDLGDEVVVESPGGDTAASTVELEPGEYEFHCEIPGHEQTMQGTLQVTE